MRLTCVLTVASLTTRTRAIVDLPTSGREILVIVGLATLAFGVTELRLVRRIR